MDRVVGVMKAYTTRVGEGPVADRKRRDRRYASRHGPRIRGHHRPARRCGWFDAVATRHATMVNGIDDLADHQYRRPGYGGNDQGLHRLSRGSTRYDYVPNDIEVLSRKCEPVYAEFPGW